MSVMTRRTWMKWLSGSAVALAALMAVKPRRLEDESVDTLCRWHCEFSTGRWPKDFIADKPQVDNRWTRMGYDPPLEADLVMPWMNKITQLVSWTAISKYWHTVFVDVHHRKTEEQWLAMCDKIRSFTFQRSCIIG